MKCLLPETLIGVPEWKCLWGGESDVAGGRQWLLAVGFEHFRSQMVAVKQLIKFRAISSRQI